MEKKAMRGYNYDMAEGLNYKIKVKNKKEKVEQNLIENIELISTGKPLEMDKTYKVAMNSYRVTGGGGHMTAAGAKNTKILLKSNEDMRKILVHYIKKQGEISSEVDGNWEIVK